jgi:flagellar basal-body rod modification protein FlgD
MTNISSIDPARAVAAQARPSQSLGQTDFLRLMTAQLKEQDPFAPVDNQQMVAQMAQMSSSTGIAEMNVSLKAIADQISAQTALLEDIRSATIPAKPATQA